MYELNSGDHHDDRTCVKCNTIREYYDEKREKIQNRIIESMGAKIVDHDLNIYIECDSCIKDCK